MRYWNPGLERGGLTFCCCPLPNMEGLSALPTHALQHIAQRLPISDRKRLALTSSKLREVVRGAVTAVKLHQQDLEDWAEEALTAFPDAEELQLVETSLEPDCVLELLSATPQLLRRLTSLQVINPARLDGNALLQLVSSCPHLTQLSVRGPWSEGADVTTWQNLLQTRPSRLRMLSLQYTSNLDPTQLHALLSQPHDSNSSTSDGNGDSSNDGSSLQRLGIHTRPLPVWCKALRSSCVNSSLEGNSSMLAAVVPAWPQLTALNLSACDKIGGSLDFLWLCPALLSLTLNSCFKVTDATLEALSTALAAAADGTQHKELQLLHDSTARCSCGNSSTVPCPVCLLGTGTEAAADSECQDVLPLQQLDLSYTRVKDAGMRHLVATLPNLSCLGLKGCNVGDDGLLQLLLLKHLTGLHIKHCHRVTDEGVQSLSSLKGLRSLSYGYTSMPEADEVAAAIGQQFTALTGLDLLASELTDQGLAALGPLKQLQQLKLYQAGVSAEGLKAIACQPAGMGLRNLVLYGCGSLRELSCLGAFPILEELQLGGLYDLEAPMAQALLQLTAVQHLTALTLERMDDLSVDVLQHIMRGCRPLQVLRVRGCDGVSQEDMEELGEGAAALCGSSASVWWAASPSADTDVEEDGWEVMQP